MDREAWRATVSSVAESEMTDLAHAHTHTHTYTRNSGVKFEFRNKPLPYSQLIFNKDVKII